MPALEKHTRGSSVSHSWQWKMLTDTRLCIPSGTTPPGGSYFHHQVTAFCKSEPLFKASSMESCRIMTNANKLSTICSVGCCRTAKRCKPSFLKTFLIFHSGMLFITINMLFFASKASVPSLRVYNVFFFTFFPHQPLLLIQYILSKKCFDCGYLLASFS